MSKYSINNPNSNVEIILPKQGKSQAMPLFSVSVSAGFPSPADDHMSGKLDLNEHLIQHPTATFFVRVNGESMIDASIHDGDLLIVDKALDAKDGDVVLAVLNGEFTVKRLAIKLDTTYLMPENKEFTPIEVTPEMEASIWGVVTNVIHRLRK